MTLYANPAALSPSLEQRRARALARMPVRPQPLPPIPPARRAPRPWVPLILLQPRSRAWRGTCQLLSPRLAQLLELMRDGSSNDQIAAAMGVSLQTLKTHKVRLAERLGSNGESAHTIAFGYARGLLEPEPPAVPRPPLPGRESQILELLIQGLANCEIGAHLHLSEDTVKTYLRRTFKTLGACSRVHLTDIALREALFRVALTPGWDQ